MQKIRFLEFEITLDTFSVTKNGANLALGPRCFDLLMFLIEHRDRYVDKDSLRKTVWNGAKLSPAAIPTCVRELRTILGDTASNPRIIHSKKGRGYRFIAHAEFLRPPIVASAEFDLELPLVNRDKDIDALRSAFRAASERRNGQLVVVRGEAGIGKSRIIDELLRNTANQSRQFISRRRRPADMEPFSLWKNLRSRDSGQHNSDSILPGCHKNGEQSESTESFANREVLSSLLQELSTSHPDRKATFNRCTDAVRQLTNLHPLILVFEDAHLADPDSLYLASWISESLQDSPLLIIVSHRPGICSAKTALAMEDISTLDHCRVFDLSPLQPDQVDEIMRPSLFHEQITAADLQRESAGNPLLITHKLRSLRRAGSLQDQQRPDLHEASRYTRLVTRFLADLSRQTQEALTYAAQIGIEFSVQELSAAIGCSADRLHSDLETAIEARILAKAGSRYGFRHGLLRDALASILSPSKARYFHAALATHLINRADSVANIFRIAHHLSFAIPVAPYKQAVKYCTLAFREARTRLSHFEAAKFADLALAISREDPETTTEERCRLLIDVARSRDTLGDRDSARRMLLEVARISKGFGSTSIVSECAMAISQDFSSLDVGIYDVAVEQLIRDALALTPTSHTSLRAQLVARLSLSLRWADAAGEQERLARESLALANQSGDKEAVREALTAVAEALQGPQAAPERLVTTSRLRMLSPRLIDCDATMLQYTRLITAYLELGQIENVTSMNRALREVVEKTRQPHHAWYSATTDAMLSLMAGNMALNPELECLFSSLSKSGLTPNITQGYAVQHFFREVECGRGAELAPMLREFADRFPLVASWRSALAWLSWELGDTDSATRNYSYFTERRIASMKHQVGSGAGLALLCEVAASIGSPSDLRHLFTVIEPLADRFATAGYGVLYLGSFARYGGIIARAIGDRDRAIELFNLAIKNEASRGAELWLGHCLVDLGSTLGERSENLRDAQSVLAHAERIALSIRVPRLLRRLGDTKRKLEGLFL